VTKKGYFQYKKIFRYIIYALLIAYSLNLYSQSGSTEIKFSGNISIFSDLYDLSADPSDSITPRRPSSVHRFVINPTITFGEIILPFSFTFSNNKSSTTFPLPSRQSFAKYLKNPINSFSIKPQYRSIQLLIGTHVPRYSELSTGDQKIFGGGFALTPGQFRFSFSAGSVKEALEPDEEEGIKGNYKRNFYAFKIGYGDEKRSHIHFNFAKASDDESSVKDSLDVFPEEGFVSSLQLRLNLPAKIYIKSEIAGSGFTRNMKADKLEIGPSKSLDPILENRESTRYDAAGSIEIAKEGRIWGIKTKGKYYGPGFKSLGYPYLQTDRLEVSLEPRVKLIQNRLMLNGSISRRVNNLSETKAAAAYQTMALINMNARLTNSLNLSARYSNFSFNSDEESDTLKIDNAAISYSITPSYNFMLLDINHNVTVSFSRNIFDDKNKISGDVSDNSSQNIMISYNLSLLKKPFSSSISYSNFSNDLNTGDLEVNTISTSLSYNFLRNKLRPVLKFGYTKSESEDFSADQNINSGITINYRITKKVSLNLNGTMILYDFGSQKPGVKYTENLLRSSIKYNF